MFESFPLLDPFIISITIFIKYDRSDGALPAGAKPGKGGNRTPVKWGGPQGGLWLCGLG